jgi:alpha-ketoglutarate-dependent taurine dioxygenase
LSTSRNSTAEVQNAFETYSVLVFPQQDLNDESQIAFSSRFGALETTQGHIANNIAEHARILLRTTVAGDGPTVH